MRPMRCAVPSGLDLLAASETERLLTVKHRDNIRHMMVLGKKDERLFVLTMIHNWFLYG